MWQWQSAQNICDEDSRATGKAQGFGTALTKYLPIYLLILLTSPSVIQSQKKKTLFSLYLSP